MRNEVFVFVIEVMLPRLSPLRDGRAAAFKVEVHLAKRAVDKSTAYGRAYGTILTLSSLVAQLGEFLLARGLRLATEVLVVGRHRGVVVARYPRYPWLTQESHHLVGLGGVAAEVA